MKRINRKTLIWLYPHLSQWNGGSRYVFEICKELSKDYILIVVTSFALDEIKSEFESAGIRVEISNSASTSSVFYWLTLPWQLKKESSFLKKILHENTDSSVIASLFPSNIVAHRSTPHFIQVCWEPYAFFYDDNLIDDLSFLRKIFSKFMKLLYSRADKVAARSAASLLTLNYATGEWIKKIYGVKPSAYTYMGVDTDHFVKTHDKKIHDTYKKFKIIFHSTDYTELKGTRWAIRAMPGIIKRSSNTLLLISSPQVDKIRENNLLSLASKLGVADKVKFIGNIPYADLPKYYSLARLYLFTGIGDSGAGAAASLSVLESLACETPVVRSNYTEEEVIHAENGFLVNPRDTDAVSSACNRILSSPKSSAKMGKEGRKRVIDMYNWSRASSLISKFI